MGYLTQAGDPGGRAEVCFLRLGGLRLHDSRRVVRPLGSRREAALLENVSGLANSFGGRGRNGPGTRDSDVCVGGAGMDAQTLQAIEIAGPIVLALLGIVAQNQRAHAKLVGGVMENNRQISEALANHMSEDRRALESINQHMGETVASLRVLLDRKE